MLEDVIVVEGKNDKSRILAIYPEANVVITNGSEIPLETLDMLEELSKNHRIILFLDPDYPGERIRHQIMNHIPTCCNVFIEKKKAIDYHKHKVGVEHASYEDIRESLSKMLSYTTNPDTITNVDLYSLGLVGQSNSKEKRLYVSNKLNIGCPNGKTFLKRLNLLQLTKEDVRGILDEKNWND